MAEVCPHATDLQPECVDLALLGSQRLRQVRLGGGQLGLQRGHAALSGLGAGRQGSMKRGVAR